MPITNPAIVRDYPYWTQTVQHEDADQMFKIMMEDFSVCGSAWEQCYAQGRGGAPSPLITL